MIPWDPTPWACLPPELEIQDLRRLHACLNRLNSCTMQPCMASPLLQAKPKKKKNTKKKKPALAGGGDSDDDWPDGE